MISFERKPAKLQYQFFWNGTVHSFQAEMRPLLAREFLDFSVRFPVAFGWLTGQTPYLETQRIENGQVVKDFSNAEAIIELALSTVQNVKIDGEEYTGDLKELPDLLVALLVNDFRMLNFLSNGDVDFFANIKNSINKSSQLQTE